MLRVSDDKSQEYQTYLNRRYDNVRKLAPEEIERILMPFEQSGRSIAEHTAGAGLGLTLAKAFTEAHGGTFGVDSALGEGFRVTVALPAP